MNTRFAITVFCLLLLAACSKHAPVSEDSVVAAIQSGNTALFKSYLDSGYPITGKDPEVKDSLAYWAVFFDKPEIVTVLIDRGLDVNHDWGFHGGNLLTNATQFNNLKVMQTLIEYGASTKRNAAQGRSPLYSALIYNNPDAATLLRKHGAKLNSWDIEALKKVNFVPAKSDTEQGAAANP